MASEEVTSSRRSGLARLVRPVLSLISLAALGYLGWILASEWPQISQWRPGGPVILGLAGLGLAYGAALFLVAETWHGLIARLSGLALPRAETYRSVTETQLGKYLPGNVAHLIGRHVWLRQVGPSHRALGGALAGEAVALVAGAGILAALVLTVAPPPELPLIGAYVWIGAPLVLLVAMLASMVAWIVPMSRNWTGLGIRSVLLTVVFFALQGVAFWLVARMIAPEAPVALIGLSAIAWIAGFLMPGAPGGLGPREFVLVTLVAPGIGQADAALAAAVFRCVTFAGDAACFLLGRILFRP